MTVARPRCLVFLGRRDHWALLHARVILVVREGGGGGGGPHDTKILR